MRVSPRAAVCLLLFLLPAVVAGVPARAADDDFRGGPKEFKKLKYRSLGPAVGGRVARACGVSGDPLTYYAATAGGGVWKSSDGGQHWKPIFDDHIATLGSIAVAPSDANVLYAGSGEANIRGNVQPGNGIYKSTDAGKTWKHVWKQVGQIGTLIVHPTNPDIAYAAVLGNAFGPGDARGVYRTVDGGKEWQRVLFKDRDTGASDICFDSANPRLLYAGLWQTRRRPWEMTSGGPGSGLYVSRDGGDSWTQLIPAPTAESADFGKDASAGKKYAAGLPEGIWGKVGLAVAPSDPRRIYAIIEADKGGLFRSDDGGDSWTLVNATRAIRQRAWYYSTLTVDPHKPDVVWIPQVPLLKSIDGGKTFHKIKFVHHGDHHDIWIDPKNPQRIIDSNDGGVDISLNGGETWFAPPLPIAQFYHIQVDSRTPYFVSGTMQDIGAGSGPSNSLRIDGIGLADWRYVGGGEAGWTAHDPVDPDIVYAGEYGGYITRFDHRTGQARFIGIYPFNPSGHASEKLRYRFQWTAPIVLSPHSSKVLYHAANVLFKTSDAGKTWTAISGDLTRNDRAKQQWSGGPITGDNTGVEVYGTIFALAESPKQKDLLWAGTDDGLVHVTQDGGKTWSNVTANIKGLPEWGTVVGIEVSPFEAGTAYVVVDNHRMDDLKPYLFQTKDFGKTWKSLSDKLAQDVHLHVVREDPARKGLLYLGSERGLHFSSDDGVTWQSLQLNLPTVAVHDLVVKNNDLVIGTMGRSIWIFDDLTPIRNQAETAGQEMHLLAAQPAVRYRYSDISLQRSRPQGLTDNPPQGVVLHYFLKSKPKGDLKIEILDKQNQVIATLKSKEDEPEEKDDVSSDEEEKEKHLLGTEPGLVHRAVWDLRYQGATPIKKARVDAGKPKIGPLVLPGVYTAKLTADGKSLTTLVKVEPDPRVKLDAAELEGQLALTLEIRDDITRLARTVEQLRRVRQQLKERNQLLKDDPKAAALVKASQELLPKLDELEGKLHNPKAEVPYDILAQKGGAQLYSQLAWLFELLKDADGAPAQGIREVAQEQQLVLKKLELEWQILAAGELKKLNDQAKNLDQPIVILPVAEKTGK